MAAIATQPQVSFLLHINILPSPGRQEEENGDPQPHQAPYRTQGGST